MLYAICTKEQETNAVLTYSTAGTFEKVRWAWLINAAFKTAEVNQTHSALEIQSQIVMVLVMPRPQAVL